MRVRFSEDVRGNNSLRVDRDAGVIHGVRVLGLRSLNGRRYTPEAVARARSLYEGVAVNVDHPARPGDPVVCDRRFGWLQTVRQDTDGGLRADLHYLKSHPLAPRIAEAAERNPRLFGLSHDASGQGRHEGGVEVIESIEEVHSVDVVGEGATVSGLHEGVGSMSTRISRLISRQRQRRPDVAALLEELASGDATSGISSAVDVPAAATDEELDDATREAFRAAWCAVFDMDSDDTAKLDRCKKILRAMATLGEGRRGGYGSLRESDTVPVNGRDFARWCKC